MECIYFAKQRAAACAACTIAHLFLNVLLRQDLYTVGDLEKRASRIPGWHKMLPGKAGAYTARFVKEILLERSFRMESYNEGDECVAYFIHNVMHWTSIVQCKDGSYYFFDSKDSDPCKLSKLDLVGFLKHRMSLPFATVYSIHGGSIVNESDVDLQMMSVDICTGEITRMNEETIHGNALNELIDMPMMPTDIYTGELSEKTVSTWKRIVSGMETLHGNDLNEVSGSEMIDATRSDVPPPA